MAIFRERFSSEDLLHLLVFCAFPIHVWTIVNMFRDVPSWALYMQQWELVSTIAYMLAFALFETLIILLPILVVGLILPKQWVSRVYVPWVGVMLVEGALAAIAFQFTIVQHSPKRNLIILIALVLGGSTLLLLRFPKIGEILRSVVGRLTVLTFLYIFVDLVGLVIVIARNL